MTNHPALHDPFHYEPFGYEDMGEPINDIETVVRETGAAFIYNPDNNGEVFIFDYSHERYWVERHRIISRNGEHIYTTLIHLQDCAESLDEWGEMYPEWAQQRVYPKSLINEGI